jgi:hypothetical protein
MLPIGTVVKLDIKSEKKLMVLARLAKLREEDEKIWDYCGCPAPEGFADPDELSFFDHSEIAQLLFIGFQDEQELKYSYALAEHKETLQEGGELTDAG